MVFIKKKKNVQLWNTDVIGGKVERGTPQWAMSQGGHGCLEGCPHTQRQAVASKDSWVSWNQQTGLLEAGARGDWRKDSEQRGGGWRGERRWVWLVTGQATKPNHQSWNHSMPLPRHVTSSKLPNHFVPWLPPPMRGDNHGPYCRGSTWGWWESRLALVQSKPLEAISCPQGYSYHHHQHHDF